MTFFRACFVACEIMVCKTARFGFSNGSFHRLKRAVSQCETARFGIMSSRNDYSGGLCLDGKMAAGDALCSYNYLYVR